MTTTDATSEQTRTPPPFEFSQLGKMVDALFQGEKEPATLYRQLLEFMVSLTGAGAASIDRVASGIEKDSPPRPIAGLVTDTASAWAPDLLETLRIGSARALKSSQVATAKLAGNEAVVLVAVPVLGTHSEALALSLALPPGRISPETCIVFLQLLGGCVSLWQKGQAVSGDGGAEAPAESEVAKLHAIVSKVLGTGGSSSARAVFLQQLQQFFQADSVIFAAGFEKSGGPDIYHSAIVDFNVKSPEIQSVKQVVAECRLQKKILGCNFEEEEILHLRSLLLKEMTASFFARQSICFPLFDHEGEVVAALLFCFSSKAKQTIEKLQLFCRSKTLFDGLAVWLGNSGRTKKKVADFSTDKRRLAIVTVVALGLLVSSFLPVTFWVEGECVLEPQKRRFVAAHFNGVVKNVLKLPGFAVKEGDVLAELDGRSIELEINALEAEIQKSRKIEDVHLATGKAALAQMARLERRALEDKLQLQQERFTNLKIVSPADGIIISENLQQLEGSPVSRGEGLFEIAPLATMLAEAHISQQDISYIETGRKARIILDSFPGKVWESSVYSIFPRSELRNGRHVFLVESLLENKDQILRPGMRGSLKIAAGKKPLVWKLFRKPWLYFQKTFLAN